MYNKYTPQAIFLSPFKFFIYVETKFISWYNININNVVIGKVQIMTVNELVELAIVETKNLCTGEVFLVRDLFKGYEWSRISRSDRLLIGTLFLNRVNSSKCNIIAIEKTSSGQQQYKIK
ncbi:single-stranded DNA-binding protein [Anaerotignum sp.]|uniref:single-stranded DNA-binding protein n=1 Tax=Anaerotignum sp. TaxID=2039241 RepID=UPI003FA45DEC